MLLVLLVLPIVGFFSGSLLGNRLGQNAGHISTFTTLIACCISFFLLLDAIFLGDVKCLTIEYWVVSDFLMTEWSLLCDSLTCIMLVIVTFISSLVHLYSTEYMEHDPHFPRFMSYLSLFTFFMLVLVTSNNFLQMFVGWEGVGVSSYLLINFWFTRAQANKSAIKAMLVNRVGDFFILLAFFGILLAYNSLNYNIIFSASPFFSQLLLNTSIPYFGNVVINIIDIICLFAFFGAMGKSAQIGLHTWLPDAMEGPTPVSALIHAATMVTAGVFLVIRCSYIFEYSELVSAVIIYVGALTAFFAATTGLFQNDIKRVIAYSTCSQLGYMVFSCGLSGYDVSLFHLSNHAFFKALLFLGAGSVIHALSDEQDMRKMGGLKNLLPFSYATSVIGSLALVGFPFLAGFYSKDVILEISAVSFNEHGYFAYILGLLAACCTTFYSARLLYFVYLSYPNGNKHQILNAHEGSLRMTIPLFLLAVLSVCVGYLTRDLFIGFGTNFWGSSIFINPANYWLTDIEFFGDNLYDISFSNNLALLVNGVEASPLFKIIPLIIVISFIILVYICYATIKREFLQFKVYSFYNYYVFFIKKWFFDRVYNENIVGNLLYDGYHVLYQHTDRGDIEKFGPTGLYTLLLTIARSFSAFQNGLILNYLGRFSFAIIVILVFSLSGIIL